ncbi:unnamed protein product [Alternaria alternata]
MKFIKQIAQRLNPDLHIPGTDSPPPSPSPIRKAKSSSTLLVTEQRKELSTPPSNSSLRKKASSMFLARGSNIQDFATWGDLPTTSENLSVYSQVATIASGHSMANHFCKTCGTLMYRVGGGFPGCSILRLGTVDDFNLVETKLKPQSELFIKDRVGWFSGVQGDEVKRMQAML